VGCDKDADAERGAHRCVRGRIVEIYAEKTDLGMFYTGGMTDRRYRVYRFIAVGDTGDLVARSRARFCGIVTGRMSYANAAGGTTSAVQLVGIFDLPANRADRLARQSE